MRTTQGVSPKAKLAALFPFVASLLAVAVQWAVTGEYDRAEVVTSLTGLLSAVVAFAGAWLGAPGAIAEDVGSDALLGPEAQAELSKP